MLMVGQLLAERDERGDPVLDDDLLLLLNAHQETIDFALPDGRCTALLDTSRAEPVPPQKTYPLAARSLTLLAKTT
jgi:glycogen operon protein